MHSSDFRARLDMLSATIPSAERRRTARGVMRTCRELGDHIRRARQLHALATTDAAREAVDRLVAEIERRGLEIGFDRVFSGPFVRSSYLADAQVPIR